jgi:hypothetical protein
VEENQEKRERLRKIVKIEIEEEVLRARKDG